MKESKLSEVNKLSKLAIAAKYPKLPKNRIVANLSFPIQFPEKFPSRQHGAAVE